MSEFAHGVTFGIIATILPSLIAFAILAIRSPLIADGEFDRR